MMMHNSYGISTDKKFNPNITKNTSLKEIKLNIKTNAQNSIQDTHKIEMKKKHIDKLPQKNLYASS